MVGGRDRGVREIQKPLLVSMLTSGILSTQGEMVVITISYTKKVRSTPEQLQSSFNRDPLAATIKTHGSRGAARLCGIAFK